MACLGCWVLYGLGIYFLYKALHWILQLFRIRHLSEHYFFITGCDSGFGQAIAKKLDREGCHVFAGCLTEKGETELRKSCSEKLATVPLDVTNHESVLKAFQLVKDALPPEKGLSGILNNAGIVCGLGPSDWLTLNHYSKTIAVNLLGVIDVTTTFLPLVKKARGRVVNTSSIIGRYSMAFNAPYSVSKFGVEAFSDALRREMRPFRVSVHLIEPGYVKTNIFDTQEFVRSLTVTWEQCTQEIRDQYGQVYFEKTVEMMRETIEGGGISSDMSGVVNAYTHALTGLYPKARYVVGKDAMYFFLPLQSLPEWLGDWIDEKLAERQGRISPAGAPKD